MKEKHHITIAFSIALAIAAALVAFLLHQLEQARANERYLDSELNQRYKSSSESYTNTNTSIKPTNQVK